MERFRNQYRIPSARLRDWDYGSAALYFITICTQGRQPFFGSVVAGALHPTLLGAVAGEEWLKTPAIRPDMHLHLGAFVVMPDHFHAIIGIGENPYNISGPRSRRDAMHRVSTPIDNIPMDDDARGDDDARTDAMHRVSTTNPIHPANPINPRNDAPANHFGPQSKNLASIVRGYKSAVTTAARKRNLEFGWQTRFHDHIIRNEAAALRITAYILNNPANWKADRFLK